MKKKTIFLGLACIVTMTAIFFLQPAPKLRMPDRQAVNPVIGDLSFKASHLAAPGANTDEVARVRTHLAFAEGQLRGASVAHLSAQQRARRALMLDLLHAYWTAGIFPRNFDYPGERRPCFIDREGRICAVGYLVEQTAGCAAAEAINQKHQYKDLLAMNDPALDTWVASSGLSKFECALIQPSYGWTPSLEPTYVSPEQTLATAALAGTTMSLIGLNGLQMLKGKQARFVPIAGIVTGAAQLGLGIGMIPSALDDNLWNPTYPQRQHALAMMNIGLGTSSILLSTYNLITNRKPKEKPLALNAYAYPAGQRNMAMGLALSKRF